MAKGIELATGYVSIVAETDKVPDQIAKAVDEGVKRAGKSGKKLGKQLADDVGGSGTEAAKKFTDEFRTTSERVGATIGTIIGKPIGAGIRGVLNGGQMAREFGTSFTSGLGSFGIGKWISQIKKEGAASGNAAGFLIGKTISAGIQAGAAGAILGIGVILSKGFSRLKTLDQATHLLKTMGLTGEQVIGTMKDVEKAIEGTPIAMDEAMGVVTTLLQSGIKPGEDLRDHLMAIADAAGASGGKFGELATVFEQVQQKGKLMGDEVMQFMERRVPIVPWLSKMLGVDQPSVQKMITDGQISSQMVFDAVEANAKGFSKEMGNTIEGAITNLTTKFSKIGADLISAIFGLKPGEGTELTDVIKDFTTKLQTIDTWINQHRDEIHQFFVDMGNTIKTVVDKLRDVGGALLEHPGLIKAVVGAFVAWETIKGIAVTFTALQGISTALTGIEASAAVAGGAMSTSFGGVAATLTAAGGLATVIAGLVASIAYIIAFGDRDTNPQTQTSGGPGQPQLPGVNFPPGGGQLPGANGPGQQPGELPPGVYNPYDPRRKRGQHDTGGGIDGPGGTDNVPAWLTRGEHVFTTDDVAAMGGHAGVYAFRNALHRKTGGAIPLMDPGRLYDPRSDPRNNLWSDSGSPGRIGKPLPSKIPPPDYQKTYEYAKPGIGNSIWIMSEDGSPAEGRLGGSRPGFKPKRKKPKHDVLDPFWGNRQGVQGFSGGGAAKMAVPWGVDPHGSKDSKSSAGPFRPWWDMDWIPPEHPERIDPGGKGWWWHHGPTKEKGIEGGPFGPPIGKHRKPPPSTPFVPFDPNRINREGIHGWGYEGGGAVAGIDAAYAESGKPYAFGPWDCSMYMSHIYAAMAGKPEGRYFTAAGSAAEQQQIMTSLGFKRGYKPGALNLGFRHGGPGGGHTAGTLPNGVNVENGGSGGGSVYGAAASGAMDFGDQWYFEGPTSGVDMVNQPTTMPNAPGAAGGNAPGGSGQGPVSPMDVLTGGGSSSEAMGGPGGGAPGAADPYAAAGGTDPTGRTEGLIPASAGNTGVAGTSMFAKMLDMGNQAVAGLIDQAAGAASMGANAFAPGSGAAISMGAGVAKRAVSYGFQMASIGADALIEQLTPFGAPRWLGYDYTGFTPQLPNQAAPTTTAEKAVQQQQTQQPGGQPAPAGGEHLQPGATPGVPVAPGPMPEQPGGPVQPGQLPGAPQPAGPTPAPNPFEHPGTGALPPPPSGGPFGGAGGNAPMPFGGAATPGAPPAGGGQAGDPNQWWKGLFGMDKGGIMPPGAIAANMTKQPEAVFNASQWGVLQSATEAYGAQQPGNDYSVHLENVQVSDVGELKRELDSRQRLQMMQHAGRP